MKFYIYKSFGFGRRSFNEIYLDSSREVRHPFPFKNLLIYTLAQFFKIKHICL